MTPAVHIPTLLVTIVMPMTTVSLAHLTIIVPDHAAMTLTPASHHN